MKNYIPTYDQFVNENVINEDSKINYVTITNDLFHTDSNWWVKNKLKVSSEISKALAGCKTKHVVIDIDKIHESVNEGFISEIDLLAQESKNFKEFLKAFKKDNRYKGLDTVGDVKEFEAWLQSVYDSAKENMDESEVNEASVNEGAVKQFDKDVDTLIKNIKRGYGWIEPEYVVDSWDDTSDAIDFELVKGEVLKRLFNAGVLYHSSTNGKDKGAKVTLSELGAIALMK